MNYKKFALSYVAMDIVASALVLRKWREYRRTISELSDWNDKLWNERHDLRMEREYLQDQIRDLQEELVSLSEEVDEYRPDVDDRLVSPVPPHIMDVDLPSEVESGDIQVAPPLREVLAQNVGLSIFDGPEAS